MPREKKQLSSVLPQILIISGILIIILFVLIALQSEPQVRITEYMSSNVSSYPGESGLYPDWIELYNPKAEAVDLSGYFLSDDVKNKKKWELKDVIIESGEYIVIENGNNIDTQFNFGIGVTDKTIMLSNQQGDIITNAPGPKTGRQNFSIARIEGSWLFTEQITPGLPNGEEGYKVYIDSIFANDYTLRFSEICPANNSKIIDEEGDSSDWFEIHNYGNTAINLKGFGVSDKKDKPFKWQFPEILIPADGYIVLFASGKNLKRSTQWFHTNFKLNASKDSLYLTDPNGKRTDSFEYENFAVNAPSMGLIGQNWMYMKYASPGAKNGKGLNEYKQDLSFSIKPGFYDEEVILKIDGSKDIIRYTTDGTSPRPNSKKYTTPVKVSNTAVVKARVYKEGYLPGTLLSGTFFIGIKHTLPVISVSLAPELLFSESKGLYQKGYNYNEEFPYVGANFWQEWEYEAQVEMFSETKKALFNINGGLKIFGAYSRAMAQKSFVIKLRNEYGLDRLNMQLFPEKEIYSFEAFVLRSGGQDALRAKIRDLIATKLASLLDLEYQAGYPVILYLNGEFWGVYNIREKIEDSFLSANTNRPGKEGFDLLQGNKQVLSGSYDAYKEMITFVYRNTLQIQENYEWVKERVDVVNYADYHVLQVFIGNFDGGNIRFWKGTHPEDKWRWILFDTDYSFYGVNDNALVSWLDPEGRGHAKMFSTKLITELLKNAEYREIFIKRFIYHLDKNLTPEISTALIKKYADLMRPEMPAQIAKWGIRYDNSWEKNVEDMIYFAANRTPIVMKHLKKYFHLSDADIKRYREQIARGE